MRATACSMKVEECARDIKRNVEGIAQKEFGGLGLCGGGE